MTSLSKIRSLVVALGLLSIAGTVQAQRVVVSHDEWYTGSCCFNANEKQFISNSLNWFGVGSGGSVLIYSSDGFLTNSTFTGFLSSLGLSVTVNDVAGSFAGYGAVFSEGNAGLNSAGLTSYVQGGGNVLYMGGTGIGGAASEAAYSNPFLNSFGLSFAPFYNGLGTVNTSGFSAQGPYGASLFTGVSSVYANSGNDISLTAPVSGVTTQLFSDGAGNGVFAAAEYAGSSVVPEPASIALTATGLFGVGVLVRRKKRAA